MHELALTRGVRVSVRCMVLDAQTLSGLDILSEEPIRDQRAPDGQPTTLWAYLDRTPPHPHPSWNTEKEKEKEGKPVKETVTVAVRTCTHIKMRLLMYLLTNIGNSDTATPFGRRMLRFWTTHPLFRASDIQERLDAVENLLDLETGSMGVAEAEGQMRRLPDLERKITRIHAHAQASAKGQGVAEAAASQRRVVRELLACLDGIRSRHTAGVSRRCSQRSGAETVLWSCAQASTWLRRSERSSCCSSSRCEADCGGRARLRRGVDRAEDGGAGGWCLSCRCERAAWRGSC